MTNILSTIKKAIPFLGCVFLIIIVLHLFPVIFFQSYTFNSAFENLLHPYGFACTAAALLFVLYPSFQQSPGKHKTILLLSIIVLCIAIGLTSEIIQHFFNRDASLDDLVNDTLGSVSGTLLFISLTGYSFTDNKWLRYLTLLTGILILAFTSVPFAKVSYAVYLRNNQYPILYSFEKQWENLFIEPQSSTTSFVDNEYFWKDNTSTHSLKVDLHEGEYPGVSFSDIYANWSKADTFSFALYSLTDSSFNLFIRINDSNHNNEYSDRFNATIEVKPGKNHYAFAIKDIAKGLKTRTMNLNRVETVILFGLKSDSGKSILVDSIRLNR
jgi:uncharacterized membrane protein